MNLLSGGQNSKKFIYTEFRSSLICHSKSNFHKKRTHHTQALAIARIIIHFEPKKKKIIKKSVQNIYIKTKTTTATIHKGMQNANVKCGKKIE